MITITLFPLTGAFAENKDVAADIRMHQLIPALKQQEPIVIDFTGITATTQSFIHALISDLIRQYGSVVLDSISFQACNDIVRKIITIVTTYMQQT